MPSINRPLRRFIPLLIPVLFALGAWLGVPARAESAEWQVSKSTGEVQIVLSEAQPASLTAGTSVPVGATIRTGATGRVLLTRGEETMLISPNSIVGIPEGKTEGMATTILQQAGSVLLKVEKRNVKHFEVQTPYLAAVVKGTEFRVTVGAAGSHVDVLAGQVEVSDFKSGQFALVSPGQTATASLQGAGGLSLSGSGIFAPIQQGTPRRPPASLLPVANDRPAPEQRASAQDIRLASAPVVSESSLPAGSAAKQTSWLLGLISFGQSGSRPSGRNDDLTLMLAIPGGIGVVVAVASAFNRRRRNERDGRPPNR